MPVTGRTNTHEEEETASDVEVGPLAGDRAEDGGLDDAPLGEVSGGPVAHAHDGERGGLDDETADVDVPAEILASHERGLLDDSDEADDVETGDEGFDDETSAVDDGAEGVEETFVLPDQTQGAVDDEIDEGFEDARFAAPLARETRRADRAFSVEPAPPDDTGFVEGPTVPDPPPGTTTSLLAAGLALCALHEPGLTAIAVVRDGRPEIVAELGDPDDDAGPVERLRFRVRGRLEVLAEGAFGAVLLGGPTGDGADG